MRPSRWWLLLALLPFRLSAQVDDEFRRFQEREARALERFASREDSAFTAFLARDWKAFEGFASGRSYTAPKLTTPPRAPAPAAPRVGTVPAASPGTPTAALSAPAPATVIATLPTPSRAAPARVAAPRPAAPRVLIPTGRVPDIAAPAVRTAQVPFYGGPVPIRYLRSPVPELQTPVNAKAITAFYTALATADWGLLAEELRAQSEALLLDDYAYAQFVLRLGRALAGDEDRARLMTWYLLLKSDVDARVGYVANGGPVVLLVPSTVMIYATAYYTIGGQRYYAVSLDAAPPARVGSIVTYDGEVPGRPRAADLRITRTPRLAPAVESRTLTWTDAGVRRTITVRADRNAVRYLEWFPQVEWDVWFGIRMSDAARASLTDGLRPLIAGQSERDAANTLLHFVQQAFAYQTDDQQFGREKPLSVDETLLYPYSDCEDRSILFATLVRELLGLEVVGLLYPGHMATAVRFNAPGGGDVVQVGDRTFTVADPTYLGASVGMSMPQFRTVTPTVIPTRSPSTASTTSPARR
ncbi:MAG: hypothetical protein RL139_839 [Gemmatimonadota bacterium]|jgi:hypothetical protein